MLEQKVKELLEKKLPIKLHLGCGSRLFDGYVNVDGEYMAHDPNVIICDITKELPLSDNCVDEILTVHVIEHISRQHVLPMFKEFHRVCKPGGVVAMEWPDLLKMCQEVVKHPDCLWSQDKRILKRTVAGIYGDSAKYPNPTMLHKWGYSGESMSKVFKEAGFNRVEIQPNQHGKSPIDSRVAAFK
jgi:predicted SAM-dependent methyltransferase|tara:strand:+ start:16633 stop:17190 length:558 start_codon:yes stop_codon:yes gene_type:complete